MKLWYESPDEARSDEQKRLCQRAYYNTFYATPEGRQVLRDLRRIVACRRRQITEADDALVQVILEDFVREMAETAGVMDYDRLMRAEAAIAKDYVPPVEPTETDPAVLTPGQM